MKPSARWRKTLDGDAHELICDGEKIGHVHEDYTWWYRSPMSLRPTLHGRATNIKNAKQAVLAARAADAQGHEQP
jgi:hypothetical protein